MKLDQFTPLDIEIYEPHRADFEDAVPVKTTHLRINGMEVLLPEDSDITVQGLGSKSECATVTMTVFARSVKVFREEPAEPLPEPDAKLAGPQIMISPDGGAIAPYQWLNQTWNDAGSSAHASNANGRPIQTITIKGGRQTGKTQRVIDEMIKHAQEGQQVVYVTHTMRQAYQVHEDIDRRNPDGLKASYRAHGAERVHFEGGGTIRFYAKTNTFRGMTFDVLVWDDVMKPLPEDVEFCLSRSKAPRIYHITATPESPAERREKQIEDVKRAIEMCMKPTPGSGL